MNHIMTNDQPEKVADDFKLAMRRLTATVSIITTSHEQMPFGMAVTAVCSLGVNPPSILISVAHTASMHDPLMASRKFGVNLLSHEHAELVAPFSGKLKGLARFELGNWIEGPGRVPVLADAQASLVCDVASTYEYSGHTVVIGTVIESKIKEKILPLLYENGGLVRSAAIT